MKKLNLHIQVELDEKSKEKIEYIEVHTVLKPPKLIKWFTRQKWYGMRRCKIMNDWSRK